MFWKIHDIIKYMKYIHNKILVFLIFILFLITGNSLALAKSFPSFKTLPVGEITTTTAILRGDFNAHGVNEFPVLFFQYGTQADALEHTSIDTVAVGGHYVVSQIVDGLNPNTIYFYRTVLKLDHGLSYGNVSSFKTKQNDNGGIPASQNTEALQYMLQDYDSYASYGAEPRNNDTTTFQNNTIKDDEEDDGFFSFLNFFSWGKKKKVHKDISPNQTNNLVRQQKQDNISGFGVNKQKENGGVKNDDTPSQVHNSKSASENDEWGEIVYYNTHYKNNYKQNRNSITKSSGLNYTKLFLFLIALFIFLFITRMVYLSVKRKRHFSHISKNVTQTEESKYFIPVLSLIHI